MSRSNSAVPVGHTRAYIGHSFHLPVYRMGLNGCLIRDREHAENMSVRRASIFYLAGPHVNLICSPILTTTLLLLKLRLTDKLFDR